MRVIELTKGQVAIVDDEDFDELAKYRWQYTKQGYAARDIRINGKKKKLLMHRVILNATKGMEVDHENLLKIDNRRENIRLATPTQNKANRGVRPDSKLGVKGVQVRIRGGKTWYNARIRLNGKSKWLGAFTTPEEAKLAYQKVALEHHGEFARFN